MSLSSSLIFFAFIGLATAAVYFEYQKPQPGKTPFCVDKVEGRKKVGEEWQLQKECILKKCLTDSQGTPLISYSSCGAIAVPNDPKCHLTEPNLNSSYPDCCPDVMCDE